MRVLVCGSREFDSWPRMANELSNLIRKPSVIIHGDAAGADRLAGLWARRNDVKEEAYPADWDKHGKAAGPIRNKQMLDEGKPDYIIAFLSQNSKGTKNMIDQAKKARVPCIIHNI